MQKFDNDKIDFRDFPINTCADVQKYICLKYPKLEKKILVLKQGWRTMLIAVDKEGNIVKEAIFSQTLSIANKISALRAVLDLNIYVALSKHNIIKKNKEIEEILAKKGLRKD